MSGDSLEGNFAVDEVHAGEDAEEGIAPVAAAVASSDDDEELNTSDIIEDAEKRRRKREKGKKIKEKFKSRKRPRPVASLQGLDAESQQSFLWEFYLQESKPTLTIAEEATRPMVEQFLPMDVDGQRIGKAGCVRAIQRAIPKSKKLFRFNKAGQQPRGAPYVLVLCSSALQAAQYLKPMATFQCFAVKLFAKHMKADEQAEILSAKFCPIGVGTPARVLALADRGALDLSHLRLLIVDSGKSSKQMTVFELNDTRRPLAQLYEKHLHPLLCKNYATEGDIDTPPATTVERKSDVRVSELPEPPKRSPAEGRPVVVLL